VVTATPFNVTSAAAIVVHDENERQTSQIEAVTTVATSSSSAMLNDVHMNADTIILEIRDFETTEIVRIKVRRATRLAAVFLAVSSQL
jgi:hypothetical protein